MATDEIKTPTPSFASVDEYLAHLAEPDGEGERGAGLLYDQVMEQGEVRAMFNAVDKILFEPGSTTAKKGGLFVAVMLIARLYAGIVGKVAAGIIANGGSVELAGEKFADALSLVTNSTMLIMDDKEAPAAIQLVNQGLKNALGDIKDPSNDRAIKTAATMAAFYASAAVKNAEGNPIEAMRAIMEVAAHVFAANLGEFYHDNPTVERAEPIALLKVFADHVIRKAVPIMAAVGSPAPNDPRADTEWHNQQPASKKED